MLHATHKGLDQAVVNLITEKVLYMIEMAKFQNSGANETRICSSNFTKQSKPRHAVRHNIA